MESTKSAGVGDGGATPEANRPLCRVCERPACDHQPPDYDLPGECDGYEPVSASAIGGAS